MFVDEEVELINVTYTRTAWPISFKPQAGECADVDLEYDRLARLTAWR